MSTTSSSALPDNGLPRPNRHITGHDPEGHATFTTDIEATLPWEEVSGTKGDRFSLAWATNTIPVDLNANADVRTYSTFLENKPGIIVKGGTVLRMVDISPGNISPMHRTVSLDYGVVLEGEVEAVLDSGEVRRLHRGDIVVQRATNHAWRNASATEWARMLYVLQEAEPLTTQNGRALSEDYGGIEGVRAST